MRQDLHRVKFLDRQDSQYELCLEKLPQKQCIWNTESATHFLSFGPHDVQVEVDVALKEERNYVVILPQYLQPQAVVHISP